MRLLPDASMRMVSLQQSGVDKKDFSLSVDYQLWARSAPSFTCQSLIPL
jgi:hypothetical protein